METTATALRRYRLRAVGVAVQTTLLVAVVLAVYPLLGGAPDVALAYAGLVAGAVVGALVIGRLPWDRILQSRFGIGALYIWSLLDIALITIGLVLTGGGTSSFFWLYVLTTLFFAATYPTSGQVFLLTATVGVYGTMALVDDVAIAELVLRLSVLGLTAFMATFLSRQLLGEMAGHLAARAESEHRATLLATVAEAARTMSTLDSHQVLETVVAAAVAAGFDAAELCLLDPETGTWRQAYHRGLRVADYDVVQPADVGLAGLVRARRATVVEDDYAAWDAGVGAVRAAGLRGTVASPVWSAGELAAVLIVGRREAGVRPSEVECLDLLAAQAGAALVVARRYAERQDFELELRHQASHDPLTGLPNRTFLLRPDVLASGGTIARRRRGALLFVDLDRFKAINDSLGHDAGDELLALVARRLRSCVRASDTTARLRRRRVRGAAARPPDEAATLVGERIVAAIREPFPVAGREIFIGASVGISLTAPDVVGTRVGRTGPTAARRRRGDVPRQGGRRRSLGAVRPVMDADALDRLDLEATCAGPCRPASSTWSTSPSSGSPTAASRAWRR